MIFNYAFIKNKYTMETFITIIGSLYKINKVSNSRATVYVHLLFGGHHIVAFLQSVDADVIYMCACMCACTRECVYMYA